MTSNLDEDDKHLNELNIEQTYGLKPTDYLSFHKRS